MILEVKGFHNFIPSLIYLSLIASVLSPNIDSQSMDTDSQQTTLSSPSKIIITGPKQKTLHKEELTMNEEERLTKARITHRAAYSQKRKSTTKESPEKPSGSTKHGKQEVRLGMNGDEFI